MGFFNNFFKKVQLKFVSGGYYGYQSMSAHFDKSVWYQDTFRATVDAIASNAAKGEFQAVVMKDGRISKVLRNDPMARLLNQKPNPVMSGFEFKYRMIANLETKTTAIAYIDWDGVVPKAIYPVDYSSYEFKQIVGGGYALVFIDYEGEERALPLETVVIMRKFYNDRIASGDGNGPIYQVFDMSKASDEGFIEYLRKTNKIRGIMKSKKSMLDAEDVKKSQDEFAERFEKAAEKGGIIGLDSFEEYIPLDIKTAGSANADQMAAINNRIYTYLRTPECIVQNKYTEQEGMAWREGKIKPIWEMFALAITNVYYTKHEIECGNKMIISGAVMTGMSISSIVSILNATKEIGELTTNERRELLGYPPVEGGDERQVSLNYINAKDQSAYQQAKAGEEKNNGEENGEETE
ncbi:MAG: phage portal protein [Bacilli bacterium]|nr:phage portal protein [Bacilli bacterium]